MCQNPEMRQEWIPNLSFSMGCQLRSPRLFHGLQVLGHRGAKLTCLLHVQRIAAELVPQGACNGELRVNLASIYIYSATDYAVGIYVSMGVALDLLGICISMHTVCACVHPRIHTCIHTNTRPTRRADGRAVCRRYTGGMRADGHT